MRAVFWLMSAAAMSMLGSCAHRMPNHAPYVTTDGKSGWSTQCNNWDQTIANCVQSARIVCAGDFIEVGRHEAMAVEGEIFGGSSSYPVRRLEYICAAPELNPPPM